MGSAGLTARGEMVKRARQRSGEHQRACKEAKALEGYVCAWCLTRNNLHGHHIRHYADGGPGVHENIIVLCQKCHRLVHKGIVRVGIL
jgi:5-methylcytosine-specific restriction endonuclease McrA